MKKNNIYHYDAFISYRHNDLDKFVAENLHRLLETYKIPASIVKKYNLTTNSVSRVFRDQEELPLSSNLEDPIIRALENSDYLIVICSPRLKDSMWCRREIETFIKLHGREHVLAVLVEGEPCDSFPTEIVYQEEEVINEDGTKEIVKKCYEPLAADVRGNNKKEILNKLKHELLRLVAPMFNLNYDDLRQRHRERKLKKLATITTSIAVGCILFAIYSTLMLIKINKQQIELKKDQAINLANNSFEYLEKDERMLSIETAYQALTKYHDVKMPYTALSEYALAESLNAYDIGDSNESIYQLDTKAVITNMQISPDQELLLTHDKASNLILWNIDEAKQIASFNDVEGMELLGIDYTFLSDDKFAYYDKDYNVKIVSTKNGKVLKEIKRDNSYIIKGNDLYFVVSTSDTITIYNSKTYEVISEYTLKENETITNNITLYNNYLLFGTYEGSILDNTRNTIDFNVLNIEDNTLKKQTLKGEYLMEVVAKDSNAYILSSTGNDNIYSMTISKINLTDGNILFSNTILDDFGSMLEISNNSNDLVVTSSFTAYIINGDNGNIISRSSIGESIASLMPVKNSNLFLLFTINGKNHILNPETGDSISLLSSFKMNLDYKNILISTSGYVALPNEDNRVIIYNRFLNENLKEVNKEYKLKDKMDYQEKNKIIDKLNLEKKSLITSLVYDAKGEKLFISYNDNTLDIYDEKEKKVIKTIEKLDTNIEYYFGETKDNYIVIGGDTLGYILNKDYDIIAKVDSLKAIDKKKNLLYITKSDKCYSLPIYSLNELKEMAKELLKDY